MKQAVAHLLPYIEAEKKALVDAGADVLDIGLVGTEQVYFATWNLQADAGAMITASHNPADYNGMKFVREQAIPISGDTGLSQMGSWVAAALLGSGPLARPESGAHRGTISKIDPTPAYVEHLMGYVNPSALGPLRVVANGGDGMAGPLVEILRDRLPLEFFPMHMVPDGMNTAASLPSRSATRSALTPFSSTR